MLDRKDFEMRQAIGMPPNVLVGINKDWLNRGTVTEPQVVDDRGMTPHPKLRDLIRVFASDHPECIIECRYSVWSPEGGADHFRFWHKNDLIGELGLTHRGKYTVTSRNIREGLERGANRETENKGKVLKYMRTFVPQSLESKMSEVMPRIESAFNRACGDNYEKYSESYRRVSKYLDKYVMENWERLSPIMLAEGATQAMLDKFYNSIEPYKMSKDMHDKFGSKAVMVSIENGGVYCVTNPTVNGVSPVNRYTVYSSSESLPDNIRRGIGMLKLVDEGFLDGVGYKASETRFVVLLGDGNE